jgi:hypothetical protein
VCIQNLVCAGTFSTQKVTDISWRLGYPAPQAFDLLLSLYVLEQLSKKREDLLFFVSALLYQGQEGGCQKRLYIIRLLVVSSSTLLVLRLICTFGQLSTTSSTSLAESGPMSLYL